MEIIYHPLVIKDDIPSLDKSIKERIIFIIENKIAIDPVVYGLPLRGSLHKCLKVRVGKYRIIYTLVKNQIRIVGIDHRKDIYEVIFGRL